MAAIISDFAAAQVSATLDGIGLLNIKKTYKKRVPSFSGRIHLNINEHPIWDTCKIQDAGYKIPDYHASENSLPIFHAWWPSQFSIEDKNIKNSQLTEMPCLTPSVRI